MSTAYELVVDNFAGGGGASTGIAMALGRSVDIAINHDHIALAMHTANHPDTKHYCEDVWEVDPRQATGGRPVALAWFSPDCKHFSKAKGGKPVDKNIRGLAWVAVRWAATVHPRVIILENVEEFKTWGPIIDGQPDPKQKGRTFNSFVHALQRQGYIVEWRELRACDYGAPTIRKRFFLIARCDGNPIVWPEPTHGDPKSLSVQSGRLLPWRTAAEIIDWSIPCPSIFERPRPLAENTLRRIARGLQRFVLENPDPFIVKLNHTIKDGSYDCFRGQSIHESLQTITSSPGFAVVEPYIVKFQQNSIGQTLDEPIYTVMAGATRFGLVEPYITRIGQIGFGGDGMQYPIEKPLTTITTKAEHCLVAPVLTPYHGLKGNEARGQEVTSPISTLDTSNRISLVSAFLSKYYYGNYTGPGSSMEDPVHTITSKDHNALVTSHIIKLKGTNIGQQLTMPLHTLTAGGLHFGEVQAFLLKYYGKDTGQDCCEPLHTVTSRDTFGLVTIHGEDYQIVDIGMRMLEPRELYNAQGFPGDYIINRDEFYRPMSKSAQVHMCGNSVSPVIPAALVRSNLPEHCTEKKEALA